MKIVHQHDINATTHCVFHPEKLELESVFPFDIYIKKENNFVIIIEKGTPLTSQIQKLLTSHKTLYMLSEDRDKEKLTCNSLYDYLHMSSNLPKQALSFLYKVNKKLFVSSLNIQYSATTTNCLHKIISNILNILQEEKTFLKKNIHYFSDKYSIDKHSLHVTIYALNLGMLLQFDKHKLELLGMAGLLHDVGLEEYKESIYHESELSKKEHEIMRKHPMLSINIAEHNHIHNPYVIEAIHHHHERYDGSGYPDKLHAKQMSQFASILAICDVFDALTTDRPYRQKYSYFDALKLMLKDKSMRGQFNEEYLKLLLTSLI